MITSTVFDFRHTGFPPLCIILKFYIVKFFLRNFLFKLSVTLLMKSCIILIKKMKS